MDRWDGIIGCPSLDCARDGSGGTESMLHREYGVKNNARDGSLDPLVGDIGGSTNRPP